MLPTPELLNQSNIKYRDKWKCDLFLLKSTLKWMKNNPHIFSSHIKKNRRIKQSPASCKRLHETVALLSACKFHIFQISASIRQGENKAKCAFCTCVQAVNKDYSKAPFVWIEKRRRKKQLRDPHPSSAVCWSGSVDLQRAVVLPPLFFFHFWVHLANSENNKGCVPAGGWLGELISRVLSRYNTLVTNTALINEL